MTTNQTIDGVPREDLRELHVMLCSDPAVQDGSVYGDIRDRLRALLDASEKSDYLQSCETSHNALAFLGAKE